MSSFRDRPVLRLALIGVLAASLGLAGCGRKGPLDPPPGAPAEGASQTDAAPQSSPMGAIMPSGGGASDERTFEPTAPKKRIFLDGLLN